ncbi:hypothetical protein ACPOL_6866 (plasmid) [Acidisarcina polymorpha]|uniref:Transferrin-like domain-containing protein n=1 Tax=Acidisarcina polymorpha TaxID=2211140 RepID=A0A2Z5GBJ1_9BACT|nr:hypothetical protein ACPOL_6866 [Acidisarcina polymorpha]
MRSAAALFSSSTLFFSEDFSLPDFGSSGVLGGTLCLQGQSQELDGLLHTKCLGHRDSCLVPRNLVVLGPKGGPNNA